MRNLWTIAKREYRAYFVSPIAYIAALLILLIVGIYFSLILYLANQQMGQGTPPTTYPVVWLMAYLFLLTLPALSMRLMADEQRTGTLELMLTAPVQDWELVIGKWLGSFLFILTIIGVTLIYPIVLNRLVSPGIDQGLMIANYLGLIMVAGAFLAIGTAISSFFSNQFAAFFATVAVLFFLWWVIGWPAVVMQGGGDIFHYLSMNDHFSNNLLNGIVALSDIVYYLSLTALGLFLGTVAVEVRRWQ
jgi:ABC-2 type transport system permease protein